MAYAIGTEAPQILQVRDNTTTRPGFMGWKTVAGQWMSKRPWMKSCCATGADRHACCEDISGCCDNRYDAAEGCQLKRGGGGASEIPGRKRAGPATSRVLLDVLIAPHEIPGR
jgi:hypothetical protein